REENEVNQETHRRYEMSALGTLAGEVGGPDDPRVPYTDCRGNVDNGVCTAENGAGGNNAHLRQEKFPTLGSDIPLVKGTEMRLIEAEAAIRGETVNLGEFTTQINAVREFHDLDPISQPSAVGSLEYPNAEDDALSILDRERHLTLWLEGRRLNDLTRWDHPFRDGGAVVYTNNIVSQRATIMPVAESECNNNENVECPAQEVYTP
ncbi:MAG: RagB/SusD family nutrient uptake outer membrane protein, partial [Salinivenus sp.]